MKNLIVKLSALVVTGLLLLLLFTTFIKPAFALIVPGAGVGSGSGMPVTSGLCRDDDAACQQFGPATPPILDSGPVETPTPAAAQPATGFPNIAPADPIGDFVGSTNPDLELIGSSPDGNSAVYRDTFDNSLHGLAWDPIKETITDLKFINSELVESKVFQFKPSESLNSFPDIVEGAINNGSLFESESGLGYWVVPLEAAVASAEGGNASRGTATPFTALAVGDGSGATTTFAAQTTTPPATQPPVPVPPAASPVIVAGLPTNANEAEVIGAYIGEAGAGGSGNIEENGKVIGYRDAEGYEHRVAIVGGKLEDYKLVPGSLSGTYNVTKAVFGYRSIGGEPLEGFTPDPFGAYGESRETIGWFLEGVSNEVKNVPTDKIIGARFTDGRIYEYDPLTYDGKDILTYEETKAGKGKLYSTENGRLVFDGTNTYYYKEVNGVAVNTITDDGSSYKVYEGAAATGTLLFEILVSTTPIPGIPDLLATLTDANSTLAKNKITTTKTTGGVTTTTGIYEFKTDGTLDKYRYIDAAGYHFNNTGSDRSKAVTVAAMPQEILGVLTSSIPLEQMQYDAVNNMIVISSVDVGSPWDSDSAKDDKLFLQLGADGAVTYYGGVYSIGTDKWLSIYESGKQDPIFNRAVADDFTIIGSDNTSYKIGTDLTGLEFKIEAGQITIGDNKFKIDSKIALSFVAKVTSVLTVSDDEANQFEAVARSLLQDQTIDLTPANVTNLGGGKFQYTTRDYSIVYTSGTNSTAVLVDNRAASQGIYIYTIPALTTGASGAGSYVLISPLSGPTTTFSKDALVELTGLGLTVAQIAKGFSYDNTSSMLSINGVAYDAGTKDYRFNVTKDASGRITDLSSALTIRKGTDGKITGITVGDTAGGLVLNKTELEALGFDIALFSGSGTFNGDKDWTLSFGTGGSLRVYNDGTNWRGVGYGSFGGSDNQLKFWANLKAPDVDTNDNLRIMQGSSVGTIAGSNGTDIGKLSYDFANNRVIKVTGNGVHKFTANIYSLAIDTSLRDSALLATGNIFNAISKTTIADIDATNSGKVSLTIDGKKIYMTDDQLNQLLGKTTAITDADLKELVSRVHSLRMNGTTPQQLMLSKGDMYTIYNLQQSTASGAAATDFQIMTGAGNSLQISQNNLNTILNNITARWNASATKRSGKDTWTTSDALSELVFNTQVGRIEVANYEESDVGRYVRAFGLNGNLISDKVASQAGQAYDNFIKNLPIIAGATVTWNDFHTAWAATNNLAGFTGGITADVRDQIITGFNLSDVEASQQLRRILVTDAQENQRYLYIDEKGNILYEETAASTGAGYLLRYKWATGGNKADISGSMVGVTGSTGTGTSATYTYGIIASVDAASNVTLNGSDFVKSIKFTGNGKGTDPFATLEINSTKTGNVLTTTEKKTWNATTDKRWYTTLTTTTVGTLGDGNFKTTKKVQIVENADGEKATITTEYDAEGKATKCTTVLDQKTTEAGWEWRHEEKVEVSSDNGTTWTYAPDSQRVLEYKKGSDSMKMVYQMDASGKATKCTIDENIGGVAAHAEETIVGSGDLLDPDASQVTLNITGTRVGTDPKTGNAAAIDVSGENVVRKASSFSAENVAALKEMGINVTEGKAYMLDTYEDGTTKIYEAVVDQYSDKNGDGKISQDEVSYIAGKLIGTTSKQNAANDGGGGGGGGGGGTTGDGTTPDATTGSAINTGLNDAIDAHRNMTPEGRIDNGEKYGAYGAGVSERLKAIKDVRSAQQSILSKYLSKANVARAMAILGNADMTLEQKRAALKALGLSDELIELLLSGDLEAIIKAAQEQLLKDLGLTDDEIAGFFDAENKEEYLGGLELSDDEIAEIMGITDMDKALEALLSGEDILLSEEDQQKVTAILDWLNNDTDADGNIISNQKRFDEVKNALVALGLTAEEIDGLIGTDVMSFMDSELKNMTVDKARIDYLVNTVGLSEWTAKFIITGEAENLDSILTEVESIANELLGSSGKAAADAVSKGTPSMDGHSTLTEADQLPAGATLVRKELIQRQLPSEETANVSQTTDPQLEAKIEKIKEAILTAMFRGTLTPDNASSMVRQIIEEALAAM